MKHVLLTFALFVIYPLTLSAMDDPEAGNFDGLPIKQAEVSQVSHIFWNAQSIQENVKSQLPAQLRGQLTPATSGRGCNIDGVSKSEGSADACELNDDPEKMGKFVYHLNLNCSFGKYQVSICSREESKLLNQLKVSNPEKLVSDDTPFDIEPTM